MHLRLWVGQRLAELVRRDRRLRRVVDHPLRPGARREDRQGRRPALRAAGHRHAEDRRGCAVEPEVDLAGYWVDGDTVRLGEIRIGAGRHHRRAQHAAAGRPDRQGRRDRRRVDGRTAPSPPVSAGRARPRGGPARAACGWPRARPARSRRWAFAYGVASMLLGLLPAIAALPALVIVAAGVVRHGVARGGDRWRRCSWSRPATLAYLATYAALVLVGVRLLGIGMAEGFHPVHSRVGLAGLDHRAADGHGPHRPVPAVLEPVHGRVAAAARRARSAATWRRRRCSRCRR